MQIDPNQGIIPITGERLHEPGPNANRTDSKKTDRLEFGTAYQKFIDNALKKEENPDLHSVAQARELIDNGDLDSLESACLAAKAILRFGI